MKTNTHNHLSSERTEIIESERNIDLIVNIFGNDINLEEGINQLDFYNGHLKHPVYMETEKFGILFTMKGGSSFIMNLLDDSNLSIINKEINNYWPKVFKSVMKIENGDIDPDIYSEFVNIVNGKSKKDLIIVTRNPIYKWISGIYQEMEVEYHHSKTLKYILKDVYNESDIHKSLDNLSQDAFELIFNSIVKELFEVSRKVTSAHATLYNQMFYNFLELNPSIDKSKLKIIDIDSLDGNLSDLISMYHPEAKSNKLNNRFSSHRSIYKKILNAFRNSIAIRNEPLYDLIINEVRNEYYYYTLLNHKYEKYFFKK